MQSAIAACRILGRWCARGDAGGGGGGAGAVAGWLGVGGVSWSDDDGGGESSSWLLVGGAATGVAGMPSSSSSPPPSFPSPLEGSMAKGGAQGLPQNHVRAGGSGEVV